MKLYREHRREYNEYLMMQSALNGVVDEYLVAFQKTQPHSPSYSGVQNNGFINVTERYIIEVESKNLKRRAEDAQNMLEVKKFLVDLKEEELRKSRDIYDLVYAAWCIDNKNTREIIRDLDSKGVCYSTSHIYEILKKLKRELDR